MPNPGVTWANSCVARRVTSRAGRRRRVGYGLEFLLNAVVLRPKGTPLFSCVLSSSYGMGGEAGEGGGSAEVRYLQRAHITKFSPYLEKPEWRRESRGSERKRGGPRENRRKPDEPEKTRRTRETAKELDRENRRSERKRGAARETRQLADREKRYHMEIARK